MAQVILEGLANPNQRQRDLFQYAFSYFPVESFGLECFLCHLAQDGSFITAENRKHDMSYPACEILMRNMD